VQFPDVRKASRLMDDMLITYVDKSAGVGAVYINRTAGTAVDACIRATNSDVIFYTLIQPDGIIFAIINIYMNISLCYAYALYQPRCLTNANYLFHHRLFCYA
jgi:hypothetical protein